LTEGAGINVVEWAKKVEDLGAGTLEHLYQAIVEAHADAVLVASIAHFGAYIIRQMKEYLAERGIAVNL